jgi:hypothetical protein
MLITLTVVVISVSYTYNNTAKIKKKQTFYMTDV